MSEICHIVRDACRHRVVRFHLVLRETAPVIWRRFETDDGITLARLHRVIQAVMGWQNKHLYQFIIGGTRYGVASSGEDNGTGIDVQDDRRITLADILKPDMKFLYIYDMKQWWEHELEVEAVEDVPPGSLRHFCVDGQRACPPENCGGPEDYAKLLAAYFNPADERHGWALAWAGESFHPETYDPALFADTVNALAKASGGTCQNAGD